MELSRSKHLFSTYLVWFDYIEVKSLIYMVIPWPLTCCNYRHRPCIIIISISWGVEVVDVVKALALVV